MKRCALMLVLVTALVVAPVPARAARGSGEPEGAEEVLRLSVHPAPEPVPALKYVLLPPLPERQRGNAALQYERAALLSTEREWPDAAEFQELLELPLSGLRQKHISMPDHILREVERGARRERCQWELPLEEGFALLLPDLRYYRQIARSLALRARVEVAEGNYGDALSTLQSGLAMSRHVGQGSTVIHSLVGMVMSDVTLDIVEDWVQCPDAPNLYWALTALPDPLVETRSGFELEQNVMAFQHPELADPLGSRLGPEGWRAIFEEVRFLMDASDRMQSWLSSPTALALVTYTEGKEHLVEEGYSRAEVEAMPVLQVVAAYMVDGFERITQEGHKLAYLPYWQARPGFEEVEDMLSEVRDQGRKDALLPLLIMPAIDRVCLERARLARRIAMLRCIEAVRAYAAAHEGRLPASLQEEGMLPVSTDPVIGRPFAYSVEDGEAVLATEVPAGGAYDRVLRYVLTIARHEGTGGRR
ncbi:MAG: hypothetical protein PVJ27_02105 [Candidatus Brocadiaceae bacterium]|jgi:hypothetical protein